MFGVLLGSGFQNNPREYIWDFDKADLRSAPMFSMAVTQGEEVLFCSDDQFKIAPIVPEQEIAPVEIMKCPGGFIYDFGQSNAGVCRLTVWGEKGQRNSKARNLSTVRVLLIKTDFTFSGFPPMALRLFF